MRDERECEGGGGSGGWRRECEGGGGNVRVEEGE